MSDSSETPEFAWIVPDALTPHETGTVYFQVNDTDYHDSNGELQSYIEEVATILLVGTTNDVL